VDTPLGESSFRAWEALQLLACADRDHPSAACRPFSADRRGFVLGEGAVLYVLESEAHARARGAHIYATLAGCGLSASAGQHTTLPSADGLEAAMRFALQDADMDRSDIGYVNAEGTATARGDVIETRALHAFFGARVHDVPVSSTKPFHGHLLGASAAMDMLAAIVALDRGVIAPTLNLDAPDPDCDLDYVPHAARTDARIDAAMVNSFGFGGCNASLILRH
jgi:3-oxoacyl-(acyl-carrier-protein) synthase